MGNERVNCGKCGTSYDRLFLLGKQGNNINICPMCGASIDLDDKEETLSHNNEPSFGEEHSDWITWYYYGFKNDDGKSAYLSDKPIDLTKRGDTLFLIKEFKAPAKDSSGSSEKAKEILRTYIPDAFVYKNKEEPGVRCPRCFSTEFQYVPRKWSLISGFATNRVDRICNNCGKRF